MKYIIILLTVVFYTGCQKDKEEQKSGIICKWYNDHKICVCSTASPVLEQFSWKSETQFYAPSRVCGKKEPE